MVKTWGPDLKLNDPYSDSDVKCCNVIYAQPRFYSMLDISLQPINDTSGKNIYCFNTVMYLFFFTPVFRELVHVFPSGTRNISVDRMQLQRVHNECLSLPA
jgi:hypothetical protein